MTIVPDNVFPRIWLYHTVNSQCHLEGKGGNSNSNSNSIFYKNEVFSFIKTKLP